MAALGVVRRRVVVEDKGHERGRRTGVAEVAGSPVVGCSCVVIDCTGLQLRSLVGRIQDQAMRRKPAEPAGLEEGIDCFLDVN